MRSFLAESDNRKLWDIKVDKPKVPAQKVWSKEQDPATQSVNGVAMVANAASSRAITHTLEETSASQLMELLRKKYEIDESCTSAQARRIAGVRYEMEQQEFSSWNNLYTFASQADVDTVSLVKERSGLLPGVTITVDNVRQYNTACAAHVLGRVGKIWKEEYDELKDEGYGLNAILGKDGLEKAYEPYLRGKDGTRSVETNAAGDILAERDGVTYAIQCKCYGDSVGVKAVQEAYAGRDYYDCMVGAVLTNQYFTGPAVEAAKKLKILLWDRGYLESMIEE